MIIVDLMVPYLSRQPLAPKKMVQTCRAKTINNELILRFSRQFIFPSSPWYTYLTQCQGNDNKDNIWYALYIPQVERLGGGQRRWYNIISQKRRLCHHWTGSFIRECIIMVMTTRNSTFLNKSIQKNAQMYISL